jgi:hypothetical protein
MQSFEEPHRRLQHQHEDEGEHDRQDDLGRGITGPEQHKEEHAALKDRLDIPRYGDIMLIGPDRFDGGHDSGL